MPIRTQSESPKSWDIEQQEKLNTDNANINKISKQSVKHIDILLKKSPTFIICRNIKWECIILDSNKKLNNLLFFKKILLVDDSMKLLKSCELIIQLKKYYAKKII